MSLTPSPDLHKSLIARIPLQTGRELAEWFTHLDSGPSFLRPFATPSLAHGRHFATAANVSFGSAIVLGL